jgi:hypothetical protein
MAKRNPRLKKAGSISEYTPEMIAELHKCAKDPAYFARNYVMIKHAKRGKIKFNLYPYQEQMLKNYQDNRFNIILSARQTGKCLSGATKINIIERQDFNLLARAYKLVKSKIKHLIELM